MAVETVHDSTVSWNQITEILHQLIRIKNECNPFVVQTLILKARLNPDAKKPPKGARMEAKTANGTECNTAGISETVASSPNYKNKTHNSKDYIYTQ